MRLYTQLLTHNSCYIKGEHIRPRGVMVHSTGCNNPYLRRYVSPGDERIGDPLSTNWNQSGVGACAHAFIGRLADGSIAGVTAITPISLLRFARTSWLTRAISRPPIRLPWS